MLFGVTSTCFNIRNIVTFSAQSNDEGQLFRLHLDSALSMHIEFTDRKFVQTNPLYRGGFSKQKSGYFWLSVVSTALKLLRGSCCSTLADFFNFCGYSSIAIETPFCRSNIFTFDSRIFAGGCLSRFSSRGTILNLYL